MKKLLILTILLMSTKWCFAADPKYVSSLDASSAAPVAADLVIIAPDGQDNAKKITFGTLMTNYPTNTSMVSSLTSYVPYTGATGSLNLGSKTINAGVGTFTTISATTFTGAVSGNASTATGLAADPADCGAGQAPRGINDSGVAQNCTAYQAASANLTTFAGIAPSANVQSLLGAANYAAMRTLLDLEAGTDFYSISATNSAITSALGTVMLSSSPAASVTVTSLDNITKGGTAYGWGNHANGGYLTGNQFITMSGEVIGGGTTSIVTTLSSSATPTISGLTADNVTVDTEVYDAGGWNGDNTVPTKDAVRDKIEAMSSSSAAGGNNGESQYNSSGNLAGNPYLTVSGGEMTMSGFLTATTGTVRIPSNTSTIEFTAGNIEWNTVNQNAYLGTGTGTTNLTANGAVVFNFSGCGSTLATTGQTFTSVEMPYGGTFLNWQLDGGIDAGTATIALSKGDAYIGSTDIDANSSPSLVGSLENTASSLSGWTTTFSQGDKIWATLNSGISTVQFLNLTIRTRKQ